MSALVSGLSKAGLSADRLGLVFGVSSLNQLGSSFYIALAATTVLQACGVAMTASDWLSLLAISYFTTKAAPPVPHTSLVLIAAVVSGFGVPPAVAAPVIGLLISADVVFDMARTLVNNIGHVSIAAALDGKAQQGGAE